MSDDLKIDNNPNMNAPAQKLMDELNSLRTAVREKDTTIMEQQKLLTSSSFLGSSQVPANSPPEAKISNPQDLLEAISKQTAVQIEASNQKLIDQFVPLMKSATPDSDIWNKTKVAESIVADNPSLSMELALELATGRMEKQAIQDTKDQEASALLANQQEAELASLGNKGNASVNSPNSNTNKTLVDIMQGKWDASGMEEATRDFEQEGDIWGQESRGVTPLIGGQLSN